MRKIIRKSRFDGRRHHELRKQWSWVWKTLHTIYTQNC